MIAAWDYICFGEDLIRKKCVLAQSSSDSHCVNLGKLLPKELVHRRRIMGSLVTFIEFSHLLWIHADF